MEEKKLEMQSKNIVADNIAKLMELFPSCVTEQEDTDIGGLKL